MPAATADSPHAPLVMTKLLPPAPRDLVPRPALVERLVGGPPRRLTVICASAGWGKTTLLAAWAASPAEQRPFAWLALEPGDDRPSRFWGYVVEALRTLDDRLGSEPLALLGAPGVDIENEALPVLLNELARLPDPGVLVLDDVHVLADPEIHAQLAYFVEHLPPSLELVVASRTGPPLALARLRARGELLEVDEDHLRFSARETEILLNDVSRLALSPDEVRALRERTEGWAAGLYLAALSLRDRPDRARFVDAFSGDDRHVVDYLSAEVLAALDDDVRAFLLRTSILDRLSGSLCDAVVGRDGSARMLRDMERSNLFVVPLDDRRLIYRYHHLFGELLRRELELAEGGSVPHLHRRAAAWFLSAGDADRAIRHTIAAGDLEDAAELIAEHWPDWLLNRGEHFAIDAWLRALPLAAVRGDARLCVARVFASTSFGDYDGLDAWVDAAEAALEATAAPALRVDVASARASYLVQAGANTAALAAADAMTAIGDRSSRWTPIADGVRAHALRWEGDDAGAAAAFRAYIRSSEERGQILGVSSSHSSLALLAAEQGRWDEAEDEARRSIELAVLALAEHWMQTDAHAALALAAEQRGDRERAVAEAWRTVDLARRGGVPGGRANALLHAARILGGEEGESLVDEARDHLEGYPDPGAMVLRRLAAARGARASTDPVPGDQLSERELTVLRLLASDLSQREIGDELYLSLNTVKTHARRIFRKLGASGREDAVARARGAGLLR